MITNSKTIIFSFILCFCFCTSSFKISFAQSKTQELVSVREKEGQRRLQRSRYQADFLPLAMNFESQRNTVFCGPSTLATVLNTLFLDDLRQENKKAPSTKNFLSSVEQQHLPKNRSHTFNRFHQDTVLSPKNHKGKSKKEVLGKPKNKKKDFGMQIRELKQWFEFYDVQVSLNIVDSQLSLSHFRNLIKNNLKTSHDFFIVNYHREVLGQSGSGHISPLGAYDARSDSVLILDVNPHKHDWVWVPLNRLLKSMNTKDDTENRGFLEVSRKI